MDKIDGSNTVIYSAVINGYRVAQMKTDGVMIPHITLKDWYRVVKSIDTMKVHKDHRIIDYSQNLKYNKKGMLR